MSGHDRRAFPRATAAWAATVESAEGRVVSGEVVNLSLSGMKVRTDSEAVVDGAMVSARAWPDHPSWMREFVRMLRERAPVEPSEQPAAVS